MYHKLHKKQQILVLNNIFVVGDIISFSVLQISEGKKKETSVVWRYFKINTGKES